MATELFNRIKDFNTPSIRAELGALGLPVFTAKFSGFENVPRSLDRLRPFAEATRVVARRRQPDGTVIEDTAARGDIRIETRNPLTPLAVTAVGAALDAHDPAIDDPSQADRRQHLNDVATLRATFDAGIADATLALTTKLVLRDEGEDV